MAKVKICGNTNLADIKLAIAGGADYLGFIFVPGSKRYMQASQAAELIAQFPSFKEFVGVFFNQSKEEVEKIAAQAGLFWLQFHGEETARYCNHFMQKGFQVIKTFRIQDSRSLLRIDEYDVTAYLFDTFSKTEKGGTGQSFDWKLIQDKPYVHEKLFLAGGLNLSNLSDALSTLRPFAVDVASGVEISPGLKDPMKLQQFIQVAHEVKNHVAS